MKDAVPHVAASPMSDFADDLVQPGGCHRSQDIGGTILAMQGDAGR
jgi:hypothetical protein